jgi:hypothetical protein
VTVFRAQLSKTGLQQLSPEERRLFLSLGHIANEIKALQKLLVWSSDFSSEHEAIVHGRISFSLMLLKILAGKLSEAHQVVKKNFYHPQVSRSYEPKLSEKGKEALVQIKRYFGGANIVNTVRNTHAFHYSPESIDAALDHGEPEELVLYMEDSGNANNLFYFSEVLAGKSLFRTLGSNDDLGAFRGLIQETLSIAGLVNDFAEAFMLEFLSRHRDTIWEGTGQPVSFEDLVPFFSVRLNWFTDTSDVLAKFGGKASDTEKVEDKAGGAA